MQKNDDIKNRAFHYINTNLSGILCPICGFDKSRHLYTASTYEPAQHFVLKEANPTRHYALRAHIAKLWGQETADVVKCSDCNFIYAYPYVAGDSTFYTLAYERSGYPTWKWEYQITADAIYKITTQPIKKTLNLLEIGSGNGAFVRNISPTLIPKENILCFEFSEYGRNKILEYGVSCKEVDIRAVNPSTLEKKFDVICMFQVLEHMDRLDDLFNQLNQLSNNQSHLFISVPNADRIEFNEINGFLLDMPPNHIGRYNLQVFERIAAKYGWVLLEYEIEPFNFKDTLMQLIAYRYLKISQNPLSIANQIECMHPKIIRKILRTVLAGFFAIFNVKIIYKAIVDSKHGNSQWVHLIKSV